MKASHVGFAASCLMSAMALGLIAPPDCFGAEYGIDALNSSSLYPAKLQSIRFGDYTLDSAHNVIFGSWTISWPDNGTQPVATYTSPMINQANIIVSPLECRNAVAGGVSCSIMINFAGSNGSHCFFTTPGVGQQVNFINCPSSVNLQ